jgi:hypothetical protein
MDFGFDFNRGAAWRRIVTTVWRNCYVFATNVPVCHILKSGGESRLQPVPVAVPVIPQRNFQKKLLHGAV